MPDLLLTEIGETTNGDEKLVAYSGADSSSTVLADTPGMYRAAAVAPNSDIYAAYFGGLWRIPADGSAPVLVDPSSYRQVVVSQNGDVFAAGSNGGIFRFPAGGGDRELFSERLFYSPMKIGSAGNILIINEADEPISISPDGRETVITAASGLSYPLAVAQRPDGAYVILEETGLLLVSDVGSEPTTLLATEIYANDIVVAPNNDVYYADGSFSRNDTTHGSLYRVSASGDEHTELPGDFTGIFGLTLDTRALPQSVTFTSIAPTDVTVGGTYTPTATGGPSGNPVTFSIADSAAGVCSIGADTDAVSFDAPGTCTIAADQAGGTVNGKEYAAAEQVTQDVTVGKATQVIEFADDAPTEATVGETYTPSATGGASENPVTFTIQQPEDGTAPCTITAGVVTFTAQGTCTILADQAGDENYEAATTAQLPVAVDVAATTLTLDPTEDALTATVTAPAGAGTPTGDVEFTLDDASLGTAELTPVPGTPDTAVATLADADPGTSGVLGADYDGDDTTLGGSFDTYERRAPGLGGFVYDATASAPTLAEPNAADWYNERVRISFTRYGGTGKLLGGNVGSIRRANTAPGTTFTRTVRADDGGRGSVTVPLQVDTTAPRLTFRGLANGPYARTARPVRCTATDKHSGIDQPCIVTYGRVIKGAQGGATRRWTATATDIAGNTKSVSRAFRVKG